ncbi:insulinase family protein [Roseococcus sp. SDR]|uniref:M16 family metallopeptidase n=1 Tax=Roseococcus sp. SDR TaxID=2835532 RepID=UPI001BCF86A8|nr:pitrilysin family protein [Roseococcus sp. SDR]MBS7788578.1 insulinase family protein [Roseococcus sp. SDR]MBV1843892.1 insulinase family protein [Roseococcus sp. SDR]
MSTTIFGVTLPPRHGFSVPIQLVEQGGISAWLVEDHSVPVVSIAWAWPGGAARDPVGREGLSAFAAAMLSEGAGDYDNIAFADALRDSGIGLSFSGGRDSFDGSFRALTTALPEAVRLARLAMARPRLDAAAIGRVRARAVLGARQQLETPAGIARRAFWESAYPGFPAGRLSTPESLTAITEAEIRAALAAQLRQGGVMIAASGAINATQLRAIMAELFADLPAGAPEAVPALPPLAPFGIAAREKAAPQSTLVFGQDGLLPNDPGWEGFQVALRILAGGGFTSRLMRSVREERGLTYGIGAGLDLLFGRGIVIGNVATENAKVGEVWGLVRGAWAEMAANGPTVEELTEAVDFLGGSLPLQFTDSRRTASLLLGLRQAGRPLDWLAGRPARLAALNRENVAAVARRILKPDGLVLAVAGQPQGL